MTRFRKVPKYQNRMTRFQVPNIDTARTKEVPNPSSGVTGIADVNLAEMMLTASHTQR